MPSATPVDPEGAEGADDLWVEVTALGAELLRLQRHRTTVYAGVVLENSAFRLLWVLVNGEPRTLRELADLLDLEQSTINRQVHAAIDAGYLERFDVAGSASKRIRPTAAGRAAFEHDGVIRAARYQRIFDELGAERAHQLIEHLTAFNDAWDTAVAEGH